ncbi:MAG: TVP38/TMEM64 family protein, partial [Gammaproteobacteria bacterium]
MRPPVLKAVVIILVVVGLVGGYLLIDRMGAKDLYLDMDLLVLRLRELKIVGPLLVIGLMTLAIVFNPLPSVPIAIASGAVLGHTL